MTEDGEKFRRIAVIGGNLSKNDKNTINTLAEYSGFDGEDTLFLSHSVDILDYLIQNEVVNEVIICGIIVLGSEDVNLEAVKIQLRDEDVPVLTLPEHNSDRNLLGTERMTEISKFIKGLRSPQ